MFLRFEENPNTGFVDDRVFTQRSEPRVVTHVLRRRDGKDVWCPITGVEEGGAPVEAFACKVEDSGEGRWTVKEAIDLDVPAPVITLSLLARFRSRQADSFGAKVIAALRNEFGGHAVRSS
jgi:hypothetical protein